MLIARGRTCFGPLCTQNGGEAAVADVGRRRALKLAGTKRSLPPATMAARRSAARGSAAVGLARECPRQHESSPPQLLPDGSSDHPFKGLRLHRLFQSLVDERLVATGTGLGLEVLDRSAVEEDVHVLLIG